MIAVIADDFTGAAELGGIGLRHGLSVKIVVPAGNDLFLPAGVDLLVIATDTRSMQEEGAIATMESVTREVASLHPEWIYKKTDSVLRGHVVSEIKTQLKVLDLSKALLVPANPALGRTIVDGHYFLNGGAVHRSSFATDPEFPVSSSDVQDMLRTRQEPVAVRKLSEELPQSGIVVGEVVLADDLERWAGRVEAGTFLAGASGFFTALLKKKGMAGVAGTVAAAPAMGSPALFVSGSTFDKSRAVIRKMYAQGEPVSYMPMSETRIDGWCEEVVSFLLEKGRAMVAIREEDMRSSNWLKDQLANLVQRVLYRVPVKELTIEGGATAYAILQRAGLRTFFPVQELAPGVVRMRVQGSSPLYITVKPGSYSWPESIV